MRPPRGHTAGASKTLPQPPAAYVNARKRLPIDVLGMVLWRVSREAQQHAADFNFPGWLGHRVMFIDGSGVSIPDTPALQNTFGQLGRPRNLPRNLPRNRLDKPGFPVMHTLWLFDAATGLIIDFGSIKGTVPFIHLL